MKGKMNNLMTNVNRSMHKAGFKIKKHSPEILIVTGVVGVVASTVMACKATLKVNDVLDEAKENIEKIHEMQAIAEEHPEEYGEKYPEETANKDLAITYVQTGLKLAKLYAPAVILGGLSLTAIVTSNNILRKRNVALAAAYTAVEKSFKEYRGRVVERFGKELDEELRYNIKAKEIEEKVVNEDGSESTVTKTVSTVDPNTLDDTTLIWYEGCPGWTKDPVANLAYLKAQQAYLNDVLKLKGYLFLNDVRKTLGFSQIPAGQVLGWIYDEINPVGDNFVDFGLYDINNEATARFVAGEERNVLLRFNHDGYILDKI